MNTRNVLFTVTFAIWLALDQATKVWVQRNLAYRSDEIEIIPDFFSIIHAQNTGAAFSSFEGQQVLFLVMTSIAAIALPWFTLQLPKDSRFLPVVTGMLLSGAIGNGIDRLRQGHVVDFINMYVGRPPAVRDWLLDKLGTYVYPTYNVADIALVVGVCLYLVHSLFFADESDESRDVASGDADDATEASPPADSKAGA